MSYTGEIYPTVVKNLGYGLCIGVGKLGKNIYFYDLNLKKNLKNLILNKKKKNNF